MYREIKKKKVILESRKPFSTEVKQTIKDMQLEDMLYTTMRLSGSELNREDIRQILSGETLRNISIGDHIKINNYTQLQLEIDNLLEMGSALTQKTLMRLYAVLMGIDVSEIKYRNTNPTLYEFSYNPPHFHEVAEQMDILMNWASHDNEDDLANSLLKAALFHNRLLEVFPFSEGNREIARIGMYYYLLSNGFPVFTLNFSESEYNSAIAEYLRSEDIRPLYGGLERSLYNKMEQLVQLAAED